MNPVFTEGIESLARMIDEGKLSSAQLIEETLGRIDEVNSDLNAIVRISETARSEAELADRELKSGKRKSVVHGIPFTVKDTFDTKGLVSSAGTEGRRNYVPDRDAAVVRKLREAGAIVIGKTNAPELAMTFDTDNLLFGRTRNPFDTTRTAGGSSGGEAAAIASGCSVFGIGSDTGGSIRFPAHFCGLCGLKPTTGTVSRAGHITLPGGLLDPMTLAGPITRTAGDLWTIFGIIAGLNPDDPFTVPFHAYDSLPRNFSAAGIRVLWFEDNGIVSPCKEIAEGVRRTAELFARAGANIVNTLPDFIPRTEKLFGRLFSADGGALARDTLARVGTVHHHPSMDWAFAEPVSDGIPGKALLGLLKEWDELRIEAGRLFSGFDLVICPVHTSPAYPLDMVETKEVRKSYSYTKIWNLTGNPAIAVPSGKTAEGLPFGVQLVSGKFREAFLVAAAMFIEKETGGRG